MMLHGEGFSERMGNGCIESIGQLVDIGLNLPLAPSISTPVLINSLPSHLSHVITRLQLIVKDGESIYAVVMTKVFAGVDGLIDHALGVTGFGSSVPHYRSKKAALALRSRPSCLKTIELIARMQSQILANLDTPDARWRVMGGSWENWRWKKNLKFTPRAVVDEKTIEKLIATDCGDCWVNQVPTASGLLDKTSETHCNIDLVKRTTENSYEFIELKYNDATPLFAAFEILKYSLLLLISRERREDFKYSHERNPLLWAHTVNLVVLANADYYAPYSLRWLEENLNSALAQLSTPEVALQFAFEKMPWPHDRNCQRALQFRERVYPA